MTDRKNMTLRLSAEQADELEAVARAEGISVSDAVREAIAEHIERKRKDKGFRARLQTRHLCVGSFAYSQSGLAPKRH
jgi:hypothetical protein